MNSILIDNNNNLTRIYLFKVSDKDNSVAQVMTHVYARTMSVISFSCFIDNFEHNLIYSRVPTVDLEQVNFGRKTEKKQLKKHKPIFIPAMESKFIQTVLDIFLNLASLMFFR